MEYDNSFCKRNWKTLMTSLFINAQYWSIFRWWSTRCRCSNCRGVDSLKAKCGMITIVEKYSQLKVPTQLFRIAVQFRNPISVAKLSTHLPCSITSLQVLLQLLTSCINVDGNKWLFLRRDCDACPPVRVDINAFSCKHQKIKSSLHSWCYTETCIVVGPITVA